MKKSFVIPAFYKNIGLFWVMLIAFYAVKAMPGGGCTPVAGDRCATALSISDGQCVNNNTSIANCGPDYVADAYLCGSSQDELYYTFSVNQTRCYNVDIDVTSTMGGSINVILWDACENIIMNQSCGASPTGLDYTGSMPTGNYVISVSGATTEGAFQLCLDISTAGPPPDNDRCSDPLDLTDAVIENTTNFCATETCGVTACGGVDEECYTYTQGISCYLANLTSCWGSIENSVWYSFTAPTTEEYNVQLFDQQCNSADGVQFAVYSSVDCNNGETSSLNELACTNNATTEDIYEPINMTAGSTYYIIVDGFAGAQCDFKLLVGTDIVFPVEWGNFKASYSSDKVDLYWETYSEQNNSKFLVENVYSEVAEFKSDKEVPHNYRVIGEIPGQISSNGLMEYNFTHYNPRQGFNLYRIRQIDLNGDQSSSNVLHVFTEGPSGSLPYLELAHRVGPSPFSDNLRVGYLGRDKEEIFEFELFGMNGELLEKISWDVPVMGEINEVINVEGFASGIYLYTVKNGETSMSGKLLKRD